jgi:hypothetical protein
MSKQQKNNPDLVDAPELTSSPRSGRVIWDERGNSVWEWQTAPGVFTREISSQQLEALEASDLQIVDMEHLTVRPVSGRLHTGQRASRSKPARSIFEKLLMRLGLPA